MSQQIQIQMSSQTHSTLYSQQLHYIVNQAHQTHLKENVFKRSPFNVLRVLCAYKLLYPDDNHRLYNRIIYLAKHYNPQTYQQWTTALLKLESVVKDTNTNIYKDNPLSTSYQINSNNDLPRSSTNKYNLNNIFNHIWANLTTKQSLKHVNNRQKYHSYSLNPIRTSNTSQRYKHQDSMYHLAQHNSKQFKDYNNSYDNYYPKNYLQTNPGTTYTRSKHNIDSYSLHHYISFYPHCDKYNINNGNILRENISKYSYRGYMEAISREMSYSRQLKKQNDQSLSRLDGGKSCTPIDQSFIKNIGNSFGSSPVMQDGLITHTMCMTYEKLVASIELQEKVKTALAYYFGNTKMKVFARLVANWSLNYEHREQVLKANCLNCSRRQQKAFDVLKINAEMQKKSKKVYSYANLYRNGVLLKKTFNLLRFIYDIRLTYKQPSHTYHYNPINFYFLFSILLKTTYSNNTTDNELLLDTKVQKLNSTLNYYKLHTLLRYFGKQDIQLYQIKSLYKHYHLSIFRRTYSALQAEAINNQHYRLLYNRTIMKKCLYALQKHREQCIWINGRLMIADAMKKKKLMERVMNVLIQIVFSRKIYSKRCYFVYLKRTCHQKQTALKIWHEKYLHMLAAKSAKEEAMNPVLYKMTKVILKVSFRCIKREYSYNIEAENLAYHFHRQILYNRVLKVLYTNHNEAVKQNNIVTKRVLKVCARMINIWKYKTRISHYLSIINKISKVFVKRIIVCSAFDLIKMHYQYTLNQEFEIKNTVFSILSDHAKTICEYLNNKKIALYIALMIKHKQCIKSALAHYCNLIHCYRYNLIFKYKCYDLVSYLRTQHHSFLKHKISSFHHQNQQTISKMHHVQQIWLTISSKRLLSQLKQNNQINKSTNIINYFIQHTFQSSVNNCLRNKIVIINQHKLTNSLKLKHSLILLKQLTKFFKRHQQQIQLAIQHRYTTLKAKTISIFFHLINQSNKAKLVHYQHHLCHTQELFIKNLLFINKQSLIHQNSKQYYKKYTIQSFRQYNIFQHKKNELTDKLHTILYTSIINHLKANQASIIYHKKLYCKIEQTYKKISICRLTTHYMNNLIRKKHVFMAIKFRAIKLQQIAFSSLKNANIGLAVPPKPNRRDNNEQRPRIRSQNQSYNNPYSDNCRDKSLPRSCNHSLNSKIGQALGHKLLRYRLSTDCPFY